MDRFVFPKSFYESIKTFKPAQREALYTSIFGFIFDDTEPELKSVELKRMWMLIFPILSKAKKISNTISSQSQDNLKRMSRDTKEKVERKSEQSKENVKTISRQTPFKEKEKEKDINIPPKSPKGYGEDFEKFWKEYPRHDAKQDAYKSFTKVIKDTTLDTLLNSIKSFKETESWQRDNGKYIPYASTWLNGKRWLDDQGTEEEKPKPTIPELAECPVCKSSDLIHSLGRYKCNSCKLMWEWNCEDKRWETTL